MSRPSCQTCSRMSRWSRPTTTICDCPSGHRRNNYPNNLEVGPCRRRLTLYTLQIMVWTLETFEHQMQGSFVRWFLFIVITGRVSPIVRTGIYELPSRWPFNESRFSSAEHWIHTKKRNLVVPIPSAGWYGGGSKPMSTSNFLGGHLFASLSCVHQEIAWVWTQSYVGVSLLSLVWTIQCWPLTSYKYSH